MNDSQFLHTALLIVESGLGVSFARLLALPAFLASAIGT